MFIVLLKFAAGKRRAEDHMEGHKQWLKRGFQDGIFVMSGSLQPGLGGGIVAHQISRVDLENRVAEDPFVEHGVVTAEILEIEPSRTDERLAFLNPASEG